MIVSLKIYRLQNSFISVFMSNNTMTRKKYNIKIIINSYGSRMKQITTRVTLHTKTELSVSNLNSTTSYLTENLRDFSLSY
jgi:hypothetical protein